MININNPSNKVLLFIIYYIIVFENNLLNYLCDYLSFDKWHFCLVLPKSDKFSDPQYILCGYLINS